MDNNDYKKMIPPGSPTPSQEQYSRYDYDEDHKEYIPEDISIILTNFAYPELITQHYFGKLIKLEIQSDLIDQITKHMKEEEKWFDEYYQNRKMYTKWFWLHEKIDNDSNMDSFPSDDGMVYKITTSFKIKCDRLLQMKQWIEDLNEKSVFIEYPINHFIRLLLNEMDRFLYSVPFKDLKALVVDSKKELFKTFEIHCQQLLSENYEHDTYDSTLLYDKDVQLHLQSLYYYIEKEGNDCMKPTFDAADVTTTKLTTPTKSTTQEADKKPPAVTESAPPSTDTLPKHKKYKVGSSRTSK